MIKTIIIDYDGTLELGEGKMNMKLIDTLNKEDCRKLVWSSRDWLYYDYIKFNLDKAGLKYDSIYCGKPLADIYLDNKCQDWREYVK